MGDSTVNRAPPPLTRTRTPLAAVLGLLLICVFLAEVCVHTLLDGADLAPSGTASALADAALTCLLFWPVAWRLLVGPLVRRDEEHRARADAALENFRVLVENAPDAVVVHAKGRFAYVNPAALRFLGYDAPGELLGHDVLDIVHPDDRALVVRRMAAAPGPGEPLPPQEERFLRRDGSTIHAEVVGMPITFMGEAARLIMARDVTARHQMKARLATADRLASVGSLAAGVAHEINNPLSFVVANLGFLRDETESLLGFARQLAAQPASLALAATAGTLTARLTEFGHALDDAGEGTERVRQIVRDLKTLSRVGETEIGPLDLRPVLDSCCNIAWTEVRHRARLEKEYREVPLVRANQGRLGQVFLNLLVNAAQAIPEGGQDRNTIRVRTGRDGLGNATVEVADTGAGMTDEVRRQIFTPFFTTKREGEGTGLGLSISHRIVSDLGGTITVESAPGKGSTFRVTLPAAEAASVPAAAAKDAPRGRVLVVGTDELTTSLLRRGLSSDHSVSFVGGVRDALSAVETAGGFDAIIGDLSEPNATVLDLHDELVRRGAGTGAFVFLSGAGPLPQRVEAFVENDAHPRLETPFELRDLRAIVGALVARRGKPQSR